MLKFQIHLYENNHMIVFMCTSYPLMVELLRLFPLGNTKSTQLKDVEWYFYLTGETEATFSV